MKALIFNRNFWATVLVFAALLAGYVFGQSAKIPRADNLTKAGVSNYLGDVMIKSAVYQELLGKRRNAADDDQLGAFFLESSPSEKPYLQLVFTNWVPRVEVGTTNNLQITKSNVMDRVTGKHAKLFWARVLSRTNQTAQAVGGWYLSPVAGRQFTYHLVFDGTNWIVTGKKAGATW